MTSPTSSSTRPRLEVQIPRKLVPLLHPARYKGAYGGRGGAKSHFFAEQIILRCYAKPTRVVCIREVQNTIRDSVRQLLVDKIAKLGIGRYFDVLDAEIRSTNGSLIIFRGMQSYNADSIKSLEAYDIAWVEEAQTLSDVSLQLLRPTIRKSGSELWFSWNPRHRTDAVDKFFRKSPHPEAVCVQINWRDNPWFPEELRKEMLHDFSVDPVAAEHVWEGAYGAQAGAILARWVDAAEKEGRINDEVEYEPNGSLIEISSDLGFRDTASWWFWQRKIGGYSLLDHDKDSGLDADEWCIRLNARLKERNWKLGRIWLPHDARTRTFNSRYSAIERFLSVFGSTKCAIVERTSKSDRINAARVIIKKCVFNAVRCENGLDGLRAWEYEWNPDLQTFMKEPLHNWACFTADTIVITNNGACPIGGLPNNGEVLTPCGWKMYRNLGMTRANAQLVAVSFEDGLTVRCTPDHLFLTECGWRSAACLRPGTKIQSSLMRESITLKVAYIACTMVRDIIQVAEQAAAKGFMWLFGRELSGRCHLTPMFITATEIPLTTPSATLNACQRQSIGLSTQQRLPSGIGGPNKNGTCTPRKGRPTPQLGTDRLKGLRGIKSKLSVAKLGSRRPKWRDLAAVAVWLRQCIISRNTVPRNASKPLRVARVAWLPEVADVYDIEVPGASCFSLANGAVVHNSHDGDGFSYGCQVMQTMPAPEKKETGRIIHIGHDAPANQATLEDIFEHNERKQRRR